MGSLHVAELVAPDANHAARWRARKNGQRGFATAATSIASFALPNQVVRLTRVKPSLLTTKSNSAYGIQASSPFLRS
jgi:hypothetical protein